jgi:hypothetical protein
MSWFAFGLPLFAAIGIAAGALVWWGIADFVLEHVDLPFLGWRSESQPDAEETPSG